VSVLFLLAAVAQPQAAIGKPADVKATFVMYHGGGRQVCSLATRRSEPSEIQVAFTRDGKGSVIKGNAGVGIAEVADSPIIVEALPSKADTTVTAVHFRAANASLNFRLYKKGRMGSFTHLTVVRDPDANSDVPYEIASGFCFSLLPSAAALKPVQKVTQ